MKTNRAVWWILDLNDALGYVVDIILAVLYILFGA